MICEIECSHQNSSFSKKLNEGVDESESVGDNSTLIRQEHQESSHYMQLPGITRQGVGTSEWYSNFRIFLGSWCKWKRLCICLIHSVAACVLLLFCLGVLVLVEFVVVHPRPPKCDIVSLTVTQFTASTDDHHTSIGIHTNGSGAAVRDGGPIQMLTAKIVVTLRTINQILRTGIFYDHVHVRLRLSNLLLFSSFFSFVSFMDMGIS